MIVEQIWTGNAYRNFNYLIVCPETGEALAVDPLDYDKCLSLLPRFLPISTPCTACRTATTSGMRAWNLPTPKTPGGSH